MAEAEVSACTPADDAGSGAPARVTLRFGASRVFHKQQAEKRDNAVLIQRICADALGFPVRIACEIGDSTGPDERTIPNENPAGDEQGIPPSGAAGTAGTTATSAAKETGARSGAAKDPAVMKIVDAFDGQIVKG